MDKLIESNKLESPEVLYNEKNNTIFIVGNSFMELPQPFYQDLSLKIVEFLNEFFQKSTQSINLAIYLEYFNTASSLSILEFLLKLEKKYLKTKRLNIFWFEEGDENGEDIKPEIASIIKLPFNFVPIHPDVDDFKRYVFTYIY